MPGPWGRAIAHLRIERRLSQRVVAKRAKMTPTTYGRIERGQHTQTRKLQDIADVFGVPVEQVLQHLSLQSETVTGNTALIPQGAQHEQRRQVPAIESAAAIHEMQAQINALQHEIAKLVADQEVDRRRRKRVSGPRDRKSVRPRNIRKAR